MIIEWNKPCIELIAIYVHPKNSTGNHLPSPLRAKMALDHSRSVLENKFLENKSGRIFAFDKSLYKILPTNLGPCKPTIYTFYTLHLRWKSTMALCFYHTDLRQNAVFHNFSRQIALIRYSGPSKHAWGFSETVQKISKITDTASRFSLLTKLLPNRLFAWLGHVISFR